MSLPGVPFALLQDVDVDLSSYGMLFWIVILGAIAFEIAAMWKVFEKAGKPGWAAIVPIYNTVVLIQIAGKPVWWIILMLIPLVNIVVLFIVSLAVAENFGKGTLFGIGLVFLAFIFYPVLGFGDAQYQPGSTG